MTDSDFDLRGEHIAIAALLKATGIAASGGAAKALLAEGQVHVNGEPESRRGRKLRAGDVVTIGDVRVRVRNAE